MRFRKFVVVPLFTLFTSCDDREPELKRTSNSCVRSLEDRAWAYMRVVVRYMVSRDFSKSHSSLITLIQERVFPTISEFWSHAISVRALTEPLTVTRSCRVIRGKCVKELPSFCSSRSGHKVRIPKDLLGDISIHEGNNVRKIPGGKGEVSDFMVLVSVDDDESCGDMHGGTIATAYACRWDECDRPIMGAVNICPRAVDPKSEHSVQSLFSTLAHEMTHVFGFSSDNFQYMRHILGIPRISATRRKVVHYTCSIDNGMAYVEWDVSPKTTNRRNLYRYVFPVGIVDGGSARGVGTGCRCPFDPARRYTSEDISHCLMHRDECIFRITTPRVAAMARVFFDCPSLAGAELENQRSEVSCQILDSHWKQRVFGEEYMTAVAARTHAEVSPVTFAFLEDTGWYRMNYAMTTALVPGAHFGFKAGCSFVNDQCISSEGTVVQSNHNTKAFCLNAGVVCSADGTHKVDCSIQSSPLRTDVGSAYLYPISGKSRMDDFCPLYRSVDDSDCTDSAEVDYPWELRSKASRCMDAVDASDGAVKASCVSLQCYESGHEYSITIRKSDSEKETIPDRCKSAGQMVKYGSLEFKCIHPVVVCSVRDYAHVGYIDIIPSVPGSVLNDQSRLDAQQASNKIYSHSSGPMYYKPGRR